MSDEFKPPEAIPWKTKALGVAVRIHEEALRVIYQNWGEPIEDWCHRMNTSDDPEAVAFRERWAKTESGRGRP